MLLIAMFMFVLFVFAPIIAKLGTIILDQMTRASFKVYNHFVTEAIDENNEDNVLNGSIIILMAIMALTMIILIIGGCIIS